MSTISKRLMALALLAGPMATNADSVTYDFTGVVTTVATGPSSFLGTAVTGTFTFTYTSADTITGTVGSSSPWGIQASGQPDYIPPPVFASSVTSTTGLFSFTSLPIPPQDPNGVSFVNGSGSTFSAGEYESAYPASSYFDIAGGIAYDAAGYPVLSTGASAVGGFYSGGDPVGVGGPGKCVGGLLCLEYTVTSLTLAAGPPHVSPVVTGTQGLSGWYISSTTLTWNILSNPNPTTSGCGAYSVPNTKGKTYKCSATNSLGSATDAITLKVDTVRPDVTITTPLKGGTYALNSTVYASYACSDKTSGVASCSGTVPDGATVPTSQKGAHKFTVTSTDNAGNAEIKTVSYKVE